MEQNHWVTGNVRSGKTQALVDFARQWWSDAACDYQTGQSVLLFAMNSENRQQVTERVLAATNGKMPLRSTTPLGFFEDEVLLFWPLISPQLTQQITAPLRLRPEAEQYLAVQLWGQERLASLNLLEQFSAERWARNLLDVIQLAAFAGVSLTQVPHYLREHWPEASGTESIWPQIGELLYNWQNWCLSHGFLTYGFVSDLYWRCLLPLPEYQVQLQTRFAYILADDVENYPAIARTLFEHCDHQGIHSVFTSNPQVSVRLGLGADPVYMRGLQDRLDCQHLSLPSLEQPLAGEFWHSLHVDNQDKWDSRIEIIETVTRSQLLRQVAEKVIQMVKSGVARPNDIAIIGPGLDSLARYAFIEILAAQDIPIISWKEQRPLNSSALVRSLITLLAFIDEGVGRSIRQDNVAEMIGVLGDLDPVRAGLLADHCFIPDIDLPRLTPISNFSRWDRLGHYSAQGYQKICNWINVQTYQHAKHSLVDCLSQAIDSFFSQRTFRFDETAVLRELLETAQQFGWINERLKEHKNNPNFSTVEALMRVVYQGTMTANPYPINARDNGVVLATAYQYRIARLSHPYHFWLDITSPLWQQGSLIYLWEAEAFLKSGTNIPSDEEAAIALFQDLSQRIDKKTILCSSELSTTGQEQMNAMDIQHIYSKEKKPIS